MTLNNGSTLQLRDNVSNTFAPASTTIASGATVGFDVNNVTAGSGNTLTLSGAITQSGTAVYNVTGGNSYSLALGAITGNGGSTFNPASGVNLGSPRSLARLVCRTRLPLPVRVIPRSARSLQEAPSQRAVGSSASFSTRVAP